MAPESVINSTNINPKQWQSDSEEIVSQKAIVIRLWPTTEDVIEGREAHADLEANKECTHDEFIHEMRMDFQECDVVDRQSDEQKQTEYVWPYVDLWITKFSLSSWKLKI